MADINSLEDLIGALGKIFQDSPPLERPGLDGDEIEVRPVIREGKPYAEIVLPNNQFARIPEGTKAAKVRYDSPTDGTKRILNVSYVDGEVGISYTKLTVGVEIPFNRR